MMALEFADVRRAYRKGVNVLDGVTFDVAPGQVVGLVGKNGAGKTTLIRIAMGMLEAQGGRVRVLGLDPRADAVAMKRRLGYVAEDQILPPYMKVGEVLELHRRLFPTWDESAAADLGRRFELSLGQSIRSLSKGQARRVALLCAVAHRPELLLLDEPASGLDPAARREFLETSIRLLNESGCTILFSSHYMTDVERLADRIVMLHDGRVLLDRDLDELREGFSLALVPRAGGVTRERLLAVAGCVGVRERAEGFHAVLRLEPEPGRQALERELGVNGVRCQSVGLEDMFIELAGGQG
jgi:ABC-2 type transport system ATP-binding protein